MNYKNKSIFLSIILIIALQIVFLINNKQKTSIRYFIWNIEDVSIGKIICLSFISGLLMSTILNKTVNHNTTDNSENNENAKTTSEEDFSINEENNNEFFEMPPERDIRETQPTISVNYRVVKDNGENELENRKQSSKKTEYQDDWSNDGSEW